MIFFYFIIVLAILPCLVLLFHILIGHMPLTHSQNSRSKVPQKVLWHFFLETDVATIVYIMKENNRYAVAWGDASGQRGSYETSYVLNWFKVSTKSFLMGPSCQWMTNIVRVMIGWKVGSSLTDMPLTYCGVLMEIIAS